LNQINWQGDKEMIRELLQKLPPDLDTIAIDLNLTENGPVEKIGIECYMNWLSKDPKQWLPLLDIIKDMNLILPSKYQGLMDYQGSTRIPPNWQRYSEGIIYTNLYRKIHHIKLSFVADMVTEAKAYLAINHPGVNLRAMQTKNAGGAWLVE